MNADKKTVRQIYYGAFLLTLALTYIAAALPSETTEVIICDKIALGYVPGEIVVVFEPGLDESAISAVVEELGGRISEGSEVDPRRFVISVPEGEEETFLEAYRESPFVSAAEKNYIVKTQPEPEGEKPELKTVIEE